MKKVEYIKQERFKLKGFSNVNFVYTYFFIFQFLRA